MSILDTIKNALEKKEEPKDPWFNRNVKIMASTTMPTAEEIKKEEVGLAEPNLKI